MHPRSPQQRRDVAPLTMQWSLPLSFLALPAGGAVARAAKHTHCLATTFMAVSHEHKPCKQTQSCQTGPLLLQRRSRPLHVRTCLTTRFRAAKHAHRPSNNVQGCLTSAQPCNQTQSCQTRPLPLQQLSGLSHTRTSPQPGSGLPNMPIAARRQRSGLSHKRTTLATRTRPAKHAHCPCNSSQGWLTRAQPLGVPNHPRVRAGEESVG